MSNDDETGQSFIQYMRGRDEAGLTKYANLIFAGLAKIPTVKTKRLDFKVQLMPWVSRCVQCDQPVGFITLNGSGGCNGCEALYMQVYEEAKRALQLYGDYGFCSTQLMGLEYRGRG